MATESYPKQSSDVSDYPQAELRQNKASDMSGLYVTQQAWANFTYINQFHLAPADYLQFPLSPKTAPCGHESEPTAATASLNAHRTAPDAFMYDAETTTVAPQQTQIKTEDSSPTHYTFPAFDFQPNTMSADSSQYTGSMRHSISSTTESMSLQTSHGPQSPATPQRTVGKRRKTEDVEPGSARAMFLAKNRAAASKCRSKKKKEQDALVEEARTVERRSKFLKLEVAVLQDGLRELIEVAGQHIACPDTRIARYIQREADRLAAITSPNSPFPATSMGTPTTHNS